jgi:hypothetical protein
MTAYFFSNLFFDDQDWIYHGYICLAEGLTAIGITCYGNRNMYKPDIDEEYLIRHDKDFSAHDADMVFFHSALYETNRKQADKTILNITNAKNKKYVSLFIDEDDGVRTSGFSRGARSCDIVLKSHYNRKYQYPKNFIPWQFGISNRILNSIHPVSYNDRKNDMLVNFRPNHQSRQFINNLIIPVANRFFTINNTIDQIDVSNFHGNDLLLWKQTRGRHYQPYYDRLSNSKICACYGGVFAIPVGNYNKYTAKIARTVNDIIHFYEWDRVRQWDSWRLWEAWVAGCCIIHVDFEKYGCVLPVMPQNGEHYIGLDISHIGNLESLLSPPPRT